MGYAVILSGGKQHKVSPGQEILVDKLPVDKGSLQIKEVLLLSEDGQIKIGTPFIENCSVAATILASVKGKKLKISKFKAKVNYRKTIGFRPLYSRIRIDSIGNDSAEPKKEEKTKELKTKKTLPGKTVKKRLTTVKK